MPVRVITDSASYIPEATRTRLAIDEVSLYVRDEGAMVPETTLELPDFWGRLAAARVLPTTSQPSPAEFVRAFTRVVEGGHEALAVLISGGMSGTVESAEAAAQMVRESVPGASIAVVDSRANCMQEGFAVLAAAECASTGHTIQECGHVARESMRRSRFLFAPKSLEYLRRGGRISAAGALLGSLLKLAPVLTAKDGETGVAAKTRTHAHALEAIGRLMRADVESCGLKQVVVQYIVEAEDAAEFARTVIEPIVGRPVDLLPIGPAVGLHVGPAVGVTYETVDPLR